MRKKILLVSLILFFFFVGMLWYSASPALATCAACASCARCGARPGDRAETCVDENGSHEQPFCGCCAGYNPDAATGYCWAPICSGGGGPTATPVPNNPIGWLDQATCQVISGWSGDRDRPNDPVKVKIYADGTSTIGTLLGEIDANLPREKAVCELVGGTNCAVCPSGEGKCKHGFSFATPQTLKNNQAHTIYVYGINATGTSGSNAQLQGVPKTLTCSGGPTNTPILSPTPTTVVPTNTPILSPTPSSIPSPTPTTGVVATNTPGPSPTPSSGSSNEIPVGEKDSLTIIISPVPQIKFATTLFGVERHPNVAVRLKTTDVEAAATGGSDGCQDPKTNEVFYKDLTLVADKQGVYRARPLDIYTYNNLQFAVSKDRWISLPGSTSGKSYGIGVKGPKHRNIRMIENMILVNKTPATQDFDWISKPLEPGDLPDPNNSWKQDCTVNSIDLSLVESRIGKTDADSNKIADINYEEVINGSDVSKIVNTLKTKPDDDL